MKLRKLSTKNFKRLGSGEFEFTDGVNVIVGPNAAGKSTLLRAASVALFGVSALPGVASDIATWGTKSWEVMLDFEEDGVTYCVTRDHKTASVHRNGELVANGNRPSTLFVEGLLNRSLKDFNLLSNSRQGETTYALNYGAVALQRDVERLSGADVVEKIIGAAKALRTTLDAQIVAAGDYLLSDDDVKLLGLELAEAQRQAEDSTHEIAEQEKILSAPAPAPAPSDPRQIRKGREKYLVYVTELGAHMRVKASLEAQIEEIGPEVAEDDGGLEQYKAEVSVLVAAKRQWERACDEGRSLQKQISEIVVPEGDFAAALADAKEDLATHEKSMSAVEAMVTEKRAEVRHFEKHIKDGVCSACGTVLKGDIDEIKVKLANAKEDLLAMQGDLAAYKGLVDAKRKDVAELNANVTVQAERTKQKAKLQDSLAHLDYGSWNEATDKESLAVAERGMHDAAKTLETAEAHNKARRKLVKQLDGLEVPAAVPEVTEADVTAAEEAWAEFQRLSSAWQVQQATAKERKASETVKYGAATATVKRVSSILKDSAEASARVSAQKAKFEVAGRLVDFLRERREFYLTQVWDTVMGSASRFLQSSTEGWMTGMKLNDGAFLFEDNGGAWVPAVEASGAQSAFLGVALRVGLSQALDRDRSMMMLDEPTEAMTEENARRLMAGIGAARDQVIVVTHRTTDQGLANNVIEVEGMVP